MRIFIKLSNYIILSIVITKQRYKVLHDNCAQTILSRMVKNMGEYLFIFETEINNNSCFSTRSSKHYRFKTLAFIEVDIRFMMRVYAYTRANNTMKIAYVTMKVASSESAIIGLIVNEHQ